MTINITWPASLPDRPMTDGYEQTLSRSDVIVSEMETGPAKVRRRSLAAPRPITMQFVLTIPQIDIFEEWYDETLNGGALPFEWVHPIKRTPTYFRFTDPKEKPKISPFNNAGTLFVLKIDVSILP
jgi:hypothetical protein